MLAYTVVSIYQCVVLTLMIKNPLYGRPTLSLWVRGTMVLDMGCEFRGRGSIPSECQRSRDVDLGQVNLKAYLQ